MSNYFETIILNKVHLIQNLFAWSSVTIEWLNSDFHVCMFITSLFNVLENFKDFLSLLFSNSKLWISVSLKKLDVNTTINSFELQDNHLAAVLCYIIQAVKKFVYHDSVSSAVTEFWLKKIWMIIDFLLIIDLILNNLILLKTSSELIFLLILIFWLII